MKIAMNSTYPQTDDQLSDPEYWDELQRSGYRNISSREFEHRPSTRIDPEILRRINRPAFVPENEAPTRPERKHNVIQLRQPNPKRRNAPSPSDQIGTRRADHSSAPPDASVDLGRWIHAKPQGRDSQGNTPLHRAVIKGEPPVVIEFLANQGVDVNARNRARETALFIAASNGRLDLVEVLLKMGARPKLMNSEGISPLKSASTNGHVSVANELLASRTRAGQRKRKEKGDSGCRPQYR